MNFLKILIKILDANIILCLIPAILTLMITKPIFKQQFPTEKALKVIQWIILIYSMISIIYFVLDSGINPVRYRLIDDKNRLYQVAYWVMFLSATILPFTLLVTSFHGDYAVGDAFSFQRQFIFAFTIQFLEGITIAILIMGIVRVLEKKPQVS